MNQQDSARQLAVTLRDSTERVLLPMIPGLLQACLSDRLARSAPPLPMVRVGSGRATHHRLDLASGEHCITFGARMVADKLTPEACGGWLSTREILGRRYFGGEVSVANLLAHTGCHEFAHFLQTIAGGRRRGSVHNRAFYTILDNLHGTGVAGRFRHELIKLARERGQSITVVPVTMPSPQGDLARFSVGDLVRFGRTNELEGRVTRINRKTCSVQGTGPCKGMRYRVSPQILILQE